MFENKWKDKCQDLQNLLDNNQKIWQEVVNSPNSDIHIIKLFPESFSQYELDGDFVLDEDRVNYKAHKLSFSEAIMFKAGKETAMRQFKDREFEYKQQLEQAEAKCYTIENKLKQVEQYSDKVKEESLKTVKELSQNIVNLSAKINQLNSKIKDKDSEILDLKVMYNDKLQQKEDEINYLKAPVTDLDSGISTDWGVIK